MYESLVGDLSIVIPTCDRSDFLDACLEKHLPYAKKNGVEIYVSDNASTDNTSTVIEKWMLKYNNLNYHRNDTNIGYDKNVESALKLSNAKYTWLLGDSYSIPDGAIEYLYGIIDSGYDAFVFNLTEKLNIETRDYSDADSTLFDLGGLMSCVSCMVFSKRMIESADFFRYSGTCFVPLGVIIEHLTLEESKLHWSKEFSVQNISLKSEKKKLNWSLTEKAIKIGADNWVNFIMSLPGSCTLETKLKVSADFGDISNLFSLKSLLLLRLRGVLDVNSFKKYIASLKLGIKHPIYLVFLISILPRFFVYFVSVFLVISFESDKKYKISMLSYFYKNGAIELNW